MMIIMSTEASDVQIDAVIDKVNDLGFTPHSSRGTERTIIGVVGNNPINAQGTFIQMEGVDRIVPISRPYKLASREFIAQNSTFPLDGVEIGGDGVVLMAGPCAVEDRNLLLENALAVQEAGAHALLVEAVAPEVTQVIRDRLDIPVYGIGAGPHCDGQLLIVSDLLGIFAIQYAPYTGGGGAVKWVLDSRRRETPVVSARFAIWGQANQSRHGGPSRVAEMVSAMPHDGAVASEDRFSWVVVHAWSWFKKRGPDDAVEAEEVDQASASSRLGPASAGIMRGMAPVRWCAEALAPHVRVLTPTDLLLMMRLRLRPQATLNDALAELLRHAGQSAATRSRIAEARRLLAAGDIRKAFDSGKTAWALLRAVR